MILAGRGLFRAARLPAMGAAVGFALRSKSGSEEALDLDRVVSDQRPTGQGARKSASQGA